jgi:hypothetical protein
MTMQVNSKGENDRSVLRRIYKAAGRAVLTMAMYLIWWSSKSCGKRGLFVYPAVTFAITSEKDHKEIEDICYTGVYFGQAYI